MWFIKFGALLVIFSILLLFLYFMFRIWQVIRMKFKLKKREQISDDDIFITFYEKKGFPKEGVLELWHEISCALCLPSGSLRPQDKFGKDIALYVISSDYLDVLYLFACNRAKKRRITVDFESIKTVDDYINTFL